MNVAEFCWYCGMSISHARLHACANNREHTCCFYVCCSCVRERDITLLLGSTSPNFRLSVGCAPCEVFSARLPACVSVIVRCFAHLDLVVLLRAQCISHTLEYVLICMKISFSDLRMSVRSATRKMVGTLSRRRTITFCTANQYLTLLPTPIDYVS